MRLLFVDLNGISFAMASRQSGEPTALSAPEETLSCIRHHEALVGADAVLVAADGRDNHRKSYLPSYKANRPEKAPDVVDALRATFRAVRGAYPTAHVAGYEADDLIATWCEQLAEDDEAYVLTQDKDMLQLVSPSVSMLNPFRRDDDQSKMTSLSPYGTIPWPMGGGVVHPIRPDQVVDLQALIGDSSDGIRGLPGVGPKTGVKILEARELGRDVSDLLPPKARVALEDETERLAAERRALRLVTDVPTSLAELLGLEEPPPPEESGHRAVAEEETTKMHDTEEKPMSPAEGARQVLDAIHPQATGRGRIYAALAMAQSEVDAAIKSNTNPHFRSRYADLAAVQQACIPALTRHGIAVLQLPEADTLRTIFAHASGEYVECRTPIIAAKRDAQGYGAAVTYARRYALAAMAQVPLADDDGETAAGRGQYDRRAG